MIWLALLAGAQAALADSVQYNGGPVSPSMTGVVVDWGARINSAYTDETNGDPGLIKYLAKSSGSTGDIGGVLAQYMDNTGHNAANVVSYGNQYQITPSVSSTTIMDSQIQSELVNQIQGGHLPRPAGNGLQTIYLVLFPAGDVECIDSSTCSANAPDINTAAFCAYHGSAALPDRTNVLYAVLPDNTTGLMKTDCGTASTQFEDQTSFLTHEWSETITDPLGNAWWDSSANGTGNEVGDWCNQQTGLNGTWTVQLEWSNRDGACLAAASSYSAPTASFVAPSAGAPTQQLNFDASSSTDPSSDSAAISGTSSSMRSGISSYQWNWGDGSSSAPSATATATHSYGATGTYQVSLTVTDHLGFTSTVTHSVVIAPSGTPSATTGAASSVSDTAATLNGTVNPQGQSVQYQFLYGTSPGSLTQSTPLTAGPTGTTGTPVSANLSGLPPATTYYFQLKVVTGNQAYNGSAQSFTTNPTPSSSTTPSTSPPPQTPSAATGSASQVTTRSALVAGTVNPGGAQAVTYHFAYGTSPSSMTGATPEASGPSGTTSVPVNATVGGLSTRTTYYFRLDVSLNGQTYTGPVGSFTTATPGPGASTGGANHVTSNGANVLGTVYPNGVPTTYLVEFGTTTAYGHSTRAVSAGAGPNGVPATVTLAGLRARTTYHYRVVATSAGGTAVGSDRTFTTTKAPARAPRFAFLVRSRASIATAQHGKLKVRFTCNQRCTARFSVTFASAGVTRFAPVPLTLARAIGRIRAKGSGTATINFIPAVRRELRRYRSLKLVVSGYAVGRGTAPSAPRTAKLTLT